MKFTSTLISTALALAVSALSSLAQGIDLSLVPEFSVVPGVNRSATGDCDGINTTTTGDCNGVNGVKIPCSCPPDRSFFLGSLSDNVAAGHATNNPSFAAPWPTDSSMGSEIIRVQTSILTLQNLFGPGKGCPVESTIFGLLLADLQSGTPSVDANLVPPFDVTPGVNPTLTGDCDGINGIKIPCSCPPDRTFFIAALSENVAAGNATNNPTFPAPWPTDDSNASQITRLQTLILTLQNLFAAGTGCPVASTDFLQKLQALTG
ncbi:hypothetical protein B0H13DRAFT_2418154 [Mycena leptocephala]|nr:hypothetical protein B0H13DRAFT_2418154 [Mycena leptocephala]